MAQSSMIPCGMLVVVPALATLALVAMPLPAHDGDPCRPSLDQHVVSSWHSEQGLPLDSVYALTQDAQNLLWVGTEDGLARFDGVEFERIDLYAAIGDASEFIERLAVDDDGRIFIGTGTAGLVVLDQHLEQPPRLLHAMRTPVHALFHLDGRIFAGSRGEGLIVIDAQTERMTRPDRGRAGTTVTALAGRSQGGLWVGYGGQGVQWFDGDRFHTPVELDPLTGFHVTSLLEDSRQRLWIGTREGLFSLDGDDGRLHQHDEELGLPENERVMSLLEDRLGRIWLGTGGSGIVRLCEGRHERLYAYPDLRIQGMFEDRAGNLWLATGGNGLFRVRVGNVLPLTHRHGLPEAPVLPILQDVDGIYWIGTFGGGLARMDGDAMDIIDSRSGLSHDRVLSLARDPDGSLWAGTFAGVDQIVDGVVRTHVGTEQGLPQPTVSALWHDGERLWIGTTDGLAALDDGELTTYAPPAGTFGGHLVALMTDAAGTLWIGTDGGGLFRRAGDHVEQAPFNDLLPSHTVLDLHETDQGVLWLATAGGLVRWDGESIGLVAARHGLPDSQVMSILEDGQGRWWMSSNRGIFAAEAAALEAVATRQADRVGIVHFERADGMPRTEANAGFQPPAWRDQDGRMWYPTSDGAAMIDPGTIGRRLPAAVPVVRRTSGLPEPALVAGVLRQASRPDWIEIEYASPEFTHPHRLDYQYRLAGFDDSWYATRDRSAVFRKLPPGEYRFEARAKLAGGEWSETAGMPLVVEHHLLETVWFRSTLLGTVLMMALVLTVITARRRNQRRLRLQQSQKLESIGLLAGGIAHDFNNVLTAIIGGADNLANRLPENSEERREAEHVIAAAERGADLSRQLLAYAQRQQSTPHWINLKTELETMAGFLQRLTTGRVRFSWRCEEVGYCQLHPVQLQQVMMNLVINAQEAMPSGGHLGIQLEPVRPSRGPTRTARLAVSDDGGGIRAADAARIFEPFYTTRTKSGGSGLGLAVCEGIVRDVGGEISVQAEPGRGTTFTILLPVTDNPPLD